MSLAAISLAALVLVIIISCTTKLNVGVVALAASWIVGVYLGGLSAEEVFGGFPARLFLTLTGVTLLFTQAKLNGTLDKVAHYAVLGCRGNAGLIPIMFFFVAATLASIGPGNIATAALIAPMAMAVGGRVGIPAFLMAIMVGNGANAGSLSPFAPTGIIVNGLMANIDLGGMEGRSYFTNFLAHGLVAFGGYAAFGGLKLFSIRSNDHRDAGGDVQFNRDNWLTITIIAVLILAVLFLKINIGMGAFAAATLLGLTQAANHADAVRKVPWNVILMVCGVTVLIALLEKTQGLALFTDILARFATKQSVTAVVAVLTGLISVYSSTSGVVLPAFLPTVPGLAQRLGVEDAASIALSMNVGSHLVDVSPLSTIGALCIAAAPSGTDSRRLFNALLAWGLSMTLVGGGLSYLLFGRS